MELFIITYVCIPTYIVHLLLNYLGTGTHTAVGRYSLFIHSINIHITHALPSCHAYLTNKYIKLS